MKINNTDYRTIWPDPEDPKIIKIIDQRHLPHRLVIEDLKNVDNFAAAIGEMHVRGAGLIGATAGFGMYSAILSAEEDDDLDALLALKKLGHAEKIFIKHSTADQIARFLTMLSPILFTLAILGLYIEMNSPGFGVPGILGITCLVIALFGHHVAGLAGKEEMFLMLAGVILLALEIFVIPGFGIAGIAGIGCLLGGFVWMMLPHIPKTLPKLPNGIDDPSMLDAYLQRALINLVVTVILCLLLFWLLRKILPKTIMFRRLILQHAATKEAGYSATDEHKHIGLLDAIGEATTDLHPSGIAIIDGMRVDVVTQGGYISQGERIKVKKVKGVRVVVVKAGEKEEPTDNADSGANESQA